MQPYAGAHQFHRPLQKKLVVLLLPLCMLKCTYAYPQTSKMYKIQPVNFEVLDSLKDYELTNRVFTNIALSLNGESKELKTQLLNKSLQERTVYYASILEMQILNGGIEQYFENYGNMYDNEIIAALKNLGLDNLASEFNKISRLTHKEYDGVQSEFDNFNSAYYKNNQIRSIDSYLKKYIANNLAEFETK